MATESKITLETLFKPTIKNTNQETNVMPTKKPKRAHGSVKASIIEAFTGREQTVNQVLERLRVKDPKMSEGSVRSTVALMRKRGQLVEVRKDGRQPILTIGSGETQRPAKVGVASGTLENDLRALEAALSVIRGLQPVLERLKSRLQKLSEAL